MFNTFHWLNIYETHRQTCRVTNTNDSLKITHVRPTEMFVFQVIQDILNVQKGQKNKRWDCPLALVKLRASRDVTHVNGAVIASVFIWLESERSRWESSRSDLSSLAAKGDQCKVPLARSTSHVNSLTPRDLSLFLHTHAHTNTTHQWNYEREIRLMC